ncbi:MAG: THUMP domain-containing protein [Euryarchaeota archaeon]|nr:THUMP domain-containing protein [Euryarchaeota archaeon]
MKYDLILIRYGELSLKSPYVRKQFESTLIRNISQAFERRGLTCRIIKEWGRIYLFTDEIKQGTTILQHIFGITSISPSIQTTAEMQQISDSAVSVAKQTIRENDRFALRVTRTGNHPFTSQEVAIRVGDDIRKNTDAAVDLTHPTVEIGIDIRNKNAFLFTKRIPGSGGLPLGTQGKVIVLVENSWSLLAGWYLMRRGCTPIMAIIDDTQKEKIFSFLKEWNAPSNLLNLSQSNHLNEEISKNVLDQGCDAVVSGLTFADSSFDVIEKSTNLKNNIPVPTLYPLLAMTKDFINQKSQEVGLLV